MKMQSRNITVWLNDENNTEQRKYKRYKIPDGNGLIKEEVGERIDKDGRNEVKCHCISCGKILKTESKENCGQSIENCVLHKQDYFRPSDGDKHIYTREKGNEEKT